MSARNTIFELQIPPGPPLQSGEFSPIVVWQLPHFEKGGPGGILKTINYLRNTKAKFAFTLIYA